MEQMYTKGLLSYKGNTFCGIYGWLCHSTNKWYVGESKDVLRRTKSYVKNPTCLRKQKLIKNAITKYGIENFTCYKLEECSFDNLLNRELYWGEKLNALAPNGYNLRIGGDKKMIVSQITKDKLSKANTGKVRTKEHKNTISEATKKAMTPEICAIISIKAKGRICSEEKREKQRNAMLGKNKGPRTDEVKFKLHLASLGKKQSPETIQKKYVSMKVGKLTKWIENVAPWFLETSKI